QIWTPGQSPSTPFPIIDGALYRIYKEERRRERDRLRRISDPNIDDLLERLAVVANVQTVVTRNHGGGTTTSRTITTGAANALLIATVCLFNPGAGNPTCTGVAGTGAGSLTFQRDIHRPDEAVTSEDHRIYKWSVIAAAAGAYTITATHQLDANCVLYVEEVSGAATTSYTDGAGSSAGATTGANP